MNNSSRHLVLEIRLHEGRYHGTPEWPPAPARAFQALVAGAARGAELDEDDVALLTWLEAQDPPIVGAPNASHGQEVRLWVPNNDLDEEQGDPARTAQIRTAKRVRPRILDASIPFLFIWDLQDAPAGIEARLAALASRVYQFGRGVDMAYAQARCVTAVDMEVIWDVYEGARFRPAPGARGASLACPGPGTLQSLRQRFHVLTRRFEPRRQGGKYITVFTQAPKPRFRSVAYEARPERRLYELRMGGQMDRFAVCPIASACAFTIQLRDAAAARLGEAVPSLRAAIERTLIGRESDSRPPAAAAARIQIVPLPSIGHSNVEPGIRRVLVEVPATCELRSGDVFWAFSGLEVAGRQDGEGRPMTLVEADGLRMLEHYGIDSARRSRVWRSVTAVALPEAAARRRVDPLRQSAEAKGGAERANEEARAAAAVQKALRHVGLRERCLLVRVQREPFDESSARVEAFENKPRFTKERLWHVKLELDNPIAGPLVIGDGRFLGLGVMAPPTG